MCRNAISDKIRNVDIRGRGICGGQGEESEMEIVLTSEEEMRKCHHEE